MWFYMKYIVKNHSDRILLALLCTSTGYETIPYSNAKDMYVTQDLNSLGEIIANAQCSVVNLMKKIKIYSVCTT